MVSSGSVSTLVRTVCLVFAAWPAIVDCGMADFFTLHPSCDGLVVDYILKDTLAMIDSAIAALTVLQTTTGEFSHGSIKRNAMRNLHFTSGTGVRYPFETSMEPQDLDVVETRLGEFGTILRSPVKFLTHR